MKDKPLKAMTAFMAFSSAGYPALFIGCYSFANQARQAYREKFGGALRTHGYRVARVRITPMTKGKP